MRFSGKKFLTILAVAAVALGMLSFPCFTQEKVDREKLLAEIAAEYEFEMEGQILVVKFYVEEGSLYGITEDDISGVLCEPVEGEPLTFKAIPPNGMLYVLNFIKDEEGKVTACKMSVEGMEIEGHRIKK